MSCTKTLLSNIKWALKPIQKKGIGNEVVICSKRIGKVRIFVKGNNNQVFIDKDVLLYNMKINIIGNNNNVHISRRCRIYDMSLNIQGNYSKFSLGENAGVRQADIVIWEDQSVEIGKDAMLSYGINIRTSDSHAIYDQKSGIRINEAKSVRVGEHAWLAQNTTLLKGADIGSHSVVGFGAICSKAYPSNCIIVGAPGKVIQQNIDWKRKLK